MEFSALSREIRNDPLGWYATALAEPDKELGNIVIAALLNNKDGQHGRQRARPSLTGDAVFQQTVAAEFAALTDTARSLWMAFCSRAEIDPHAQANEDFVKWVFGTASGTVANLLQARVETVSRATELGLAEVVPGNIKTVRQRWGI
jgi:hypothetical protein